MSKQRDDLTAQVKRGARLLDKEKPKWFWLIDLPTLDMNAPNACVLGQTGSVEGNDYWDLGKELKVIRGKGDDVFQWDDSKAHAYGFSANSKKALSMLAELWAVEVAMRLVRAKR